MYYVQTDFDTKCSNMLTRTLKFLPSIKDHDGQCHCQYVRVLCKLLQNYCLSSKLCTMLSTLKMYKYVEALCNSNKYV